MIPYIYFYFDYFKILILGGLYGYNQPPVNPYADQGIYGQMYDYYDPSQQPPPMPDAMYGYEQAAAPYRGFRPGLSIYILMQPLLSLIKILYVLIDYF